MVAGPPVDLSDLYDRPIDTGTLRIATDRLMDHITALLEQIRGAHAEHERFDPRKHGVAEVGDPLKHVDLGRPEPRDGTTGGSGR